MQCAALGPRHLSSHTRLHNRHRRVCRRILRAVSGAEVTLVGAGVPRERHARGTRVAPASGWRGARGLAHRCVVATTSPSTRRAVHRPSASRVQIAPAQTAKPLIWPKSKRTGSILRLWTATFAAPRSGGGASRRRRPSAASHARNAPLGPYGASRRPSAPMTLATRPTTSPRPPLRGRFGALRADARPFAVDRAARRGRFAPRAYPTARRDGETRVPRRYGRCEDAPCRRDAFFRRIHQNFSPISVKFPSLGLMTEVTEIT